MALFKGTYTSDGQQVEPLVLYPLNLLLHVKFSIGGFFFFFFCLWPGYSKPLLVEVALNLRVKKSPISPNIVQMLDWFEEAHSHPDLGVYRHRLSFTVGGEVLPYCSYCSGFDPTLK